MIKKILQPLSIGFAISLTPLPTQAMSDDPVSIPDPIPSPNAKVSIIAIGDMGTGGDGQYKVSQAIESICAEKACDFAIGLGDNIYDSGVESINDQQWLTKFEYPYQNLDFPFYMALGNHDNSTFGGEGLNNNKGEFQVDYTYKADRFSEKWQMPARYYRFDAPLNADAPLVNIFALDSNPLAAVTDANPEYSQLPYKKKQANWVNEQLTSASAQWKIAFAHHPFISNGTHGNAGIYDYVPLLGITWFDFLKDNICDKVDLFISGHDHDLQYLKSNKHCGNTEFIISGAGAKTRAFSKADRNPSYWQKDNTKGFFRLAFEGSQLTVEAYTVDDNGNSILEFERKMTK